MAQILVKKESENIRDYKIGRNANISDFVRL